MTQPFRPPKSHRLSATATGRRGKETTARPIDNMCWGRGLPSSGKLGSLYITIVTVFLRSGETPGTPLSLREFSEGSSRASAGGAVESSSKSHTSHIIIYHDFELASTAPSAKALGRALGELRRVKGFKKKACQRLGAFKRFLKSFDSPDQIS